MSPRLVLHKLAQLVVGFIISARQSFASDNTDCRQPLVHISNELDRAYHRIEVRIVLASAIAEILKVDPRSVTRISSRKHHAACILRARLQNRPRKQIVMTLKLSGVPRLVAAKETGQSKDVEVRVRQVRPRPFYDSHQGAIRRVHAGAVRLPLAQTSVGLLTRFRRCKRSSFE